MQLKIVLDLSTAQNRRGRNLTDVGGMIFRELVAQFLNRRGGFRLAGGNG